MSLRRLLEKYQQIFSVEVFDNIAAIASRLVARRSASFRHQFGFKLLRKTNVAMCRLRDIQLVNTIETFCGTIPDYKVNDGAKQELPTRENLEFLLVRTQSTAKLLLRIAQCSREAATAFLNYIHRTFFLETCTMYLGILAEIWQMSRTLCTKVILFYNALRPYCRYFRAAAKPWLPDVYKLPANLEEFLGDEWSDESSRSDESLLWQQHESAAATNFTLSDFVNSADGDALMIINDDDVFDENVRVLSKNRVVKHEFTKVEIKMNDRPMLTTAADEIGVAISRDSFKRQMLSVDKLVTIDDVERFMREATEQHRRTGIVGNKLTKMNDVEWKRLRHECNHVLATNQGRNGVKKFKRIWTEKVDK